MTTEGGTETEQASIAVEQPNNDIDDIDNNDDVDMSSEWSNHNDSKLLKQETVLNLNNKNVRLTLWCIIYIILTTYGYDHNMWYRINYVTPTYDTSTNDDTDEITLYSLGVSTNSVTWVAVAILLCSLYCGCCKVNCNIFVALLFIIGAVMECAFMIYAMDLYCSYEDTDWETDTDAEEQSNYCRALICGYSIFFALFTFYLAIDIIKSVGNDIRVRLITKCLFVSLQCLQIGSFFVYLLDENGFCDDESVNVACFLYRTASAGNISVGIVCVIIMVLAIFNVPIHTVIRRILAYFLLVGAGSCLIVLVQHSFPFQFTFYFIPAVVLIVYDLQYL